VEVLCENKLCEDEACSVGAERAVCVCVKMAEEDLHCPSSQCNHSTSDCCALRVGGEYAVCKVSALLFSIVARVKTLQTDLVPYGRVKTHETIPNDGEIPVTTTSTACCLWCWILGGQSVQCVQRAVCVLYCARGGERGARRFTYPSSAPSRS
jgi:hypothetical protein